MSKTTDGFNETESTNVFQDEIIIEVNNEELHLQAPSGLTTYDFILPTDMGAAGLALLSQGPGLPLTWGGGGGGGGGVSSVSMTVPAFLSVSGSPVTSAGTLAITLSGTALPVVNGGTGTTTSTGSGSNVLSIAPSLVTPILGVASCTSITGPFHHVTGASSGTITLRAQAVAGTYNFNLPITAGTAGQVLTSQGGLLNAMTWTNPGTVSSVAMTVPSFLSISGSPITSSGTLAVTLSGTALPVLNGGTGTTTSTGTGSVVLSISPTVTGNLTTERITASYSATPSVSILNYGFTNTNSVAGTYISGQIAPSLPLNSDVYWTNGLALSPLNTALFGYHTRATGNHGSLSLYGSTTRIQFYADGTATTSPTTGQLVVPGGIGLTGNLFAGGTISSKTYAVTGSTSGVITIGGQAAAGTYNFNLPTTSGTAGQVLTSQGGLTNAMTWTTPTTGSVTSVAMTVPSFLSISGSPITSSGTLAVTLSGTALPVLNGGTGTTTSTGSGSTVLSISPTLVTPQLGVATCTSIDGFFHNVTGFTSGSITIRGQTNAGTYNFNLPTTAGAAGQVLTSQGGAGNAMTWSNSGSVTSVAMTVPTFLSITGSPITSSGTFAVTLSGTALPVLNGGTGTTTSTGTGSVVLSNSATLTGILTTERINATSSITPSATVPGYFFDNISATLGAYLSGTRIPNAPDASDIYWTTGKAYSNLNTTLLGFHPRAAGGSFGSLSLYGSATRIQFFADGTASTSPTTGQLTVPGGVGITGAFNSGGAIKTTATTASTSVGTGAIVSSGGLGVDGNVYMKGGLHVNYGGSVPFQQVKISPNSTGLQTSVTYYVGTSETGASWDVGLNVVTASDTFSIYSSTAGHNKMTITPGGPVDFPDGITVGGSVTTLSQYSQSTYSPTISFQGTPPTGYTPTGVSGYYTRIGNAVTVTIQFSVSYTSGTGNFLAVSLPIPTYAGSSPNVVLDPLFSSITGVNTWDVRIGQATFGSNLVSFWVSGAQMGCNQASGSNVFNCKFSGSYICT